ncbi:hypothetical protein ACFL2W_00435 [Candidatus Omnitrophota bacterium]
MKELDNNLSVCYCHRCAKDEEKNEELLEKGRIKQKRKTRINLLRGFIIIVAIALWEFSKRIPKWEQIIWFGGAAIIWCSFAMIDGTNENNS